MSILKYLSFIVLLGTSAQASRYYMILGSYEPIEGAHSPTHDGPFTHTYASFVETQDQKVIDEKTISWGPCQKHPIKLLKKIDVNLGCNKSLKFTLDKIERLHTKERKLKAIIWGPVEIKATLFESAKGQYSRLRQFHDFEKNIITSSEFEYSGIDWTERLRGIAKNCHHMVQDLVRFTDGGIVNPKDRNYGISAGQFTLEWFSSFLLPSKETNTWVWEQVKELRLHGKAYPMIQMNPITQ